MHPRIFQSTLLQEERRSEYPPIIHIPLFQSTLLQEERRLSLEPGNQIPDFNPRSYKRSDDDPDVEEPMYYIFQSTLLQEERLLSLP